MKSVQCKRSCHFVFAFNVPLVGLPTGTPQPQDRFGGTSVGKALKSPRTFTKWEIHLFTVSGAILFVVVVVVVVFCCCFFEGGQTRKNYSKYMG